MNKKEFLEMMIQDIETEAENNKVLYSDVIDCMEIALSQSPETVEIDSSRNVKDAFALIEKRAHEKKANCVGPFEAAEIIAEYLGVSYVRTSKKIKKPASLVNLEDFI